MYSTYDQWAFNTAPVQPSLLEQVETYGNLRIMPNSTTQLNPIARFVSDENTGALVAPETQNQHPPLPLFHTPGISCSHTGSCYPNSLQDPADTESSGDSYLRHFGTSSGSSSGPPDGDNHQEELNSPSSSSGRSMPFSNSWDSGTFYRQQSADLDPRLDPSLAAEGNYVSLKTIQMAPCRGEHHGVGQFQQSYSYMDGPQPLISRYNPYGSYSSAESSRQPSPARTARHEQGELQREEGSRPDLMKPYALDSAQSCGGIKKVRKGRIGKGTKGRGAGKKTKERKHCRDHPHKVFPHVSDYKKHMNQQHLRPFLCVFLFAGCTQTFGSKNEWKRHVFSQHLQTSYWRCDALICADRKAIFNRKDLFGQHIKRMHPAPNPSNKTSVTRYTEEMVERCRVERREPPSKSSCGYCKQSFEGPQSWDQRMEHVGQHYEKNNYKDISQDEWIQDTGLVEWALYHGIIEPKEGGGFELTSTGKDAIVKAGEEHKHQLTLGYGGDLGRDEIDADGDEEYIYPPS